MWSKCRELASDSVKSLSPVLWSFRRTMSQAGDSTSLKEEETVEWSLLMAQDKGKYKWGSQEPSSESGNDDHVVLLTVEQKLQGRAIQVCKDYGITSPCTRQRIYLQDCEGVVASMKVGWTSWTRRGQWWIWRPLHGCSHFIDECPTWVAGNNPTYPSTKITSQGFYP